MLWNREEDAHGSNFDCGRWISDSLYTGGRTERQGIWRLFSRNRRGRAGVCQEISSGGAPSRQSPRKQCRDGWDCQFQKCRWGTAGHHDDGVRFRLPGGWGDEARRIWLYFKAVWCGWDRYADQAVSGAEAQPGFTRLPERRCAAVFRCQWGSRPDPAPYSGAGGKFVSQCTPARGDGNGQGSCGAADSCEQRP